VLRGEGAVGYPLLVSEHCHWIQQRHKRWNPKKSKNMEKNRVQPQEIKKRRSVVLNNEKKSKNMKPVAGTTPNNPKM
jgi:hypothetical protein